MKSIFGITKPDEGEIMFKDQKILIRKPSDAIDQGIVYLSEERQQLGMTGTHVELRQYQYGCHG